MYKNIEEKTGQVTWKQIETDNFIFYGEILNCSDYFFEHIVCQHFDCFSPDKDGYYFYKSKFLFFCFKHIPQRLKKQFQREVIIGKMMK